MSSPTSILSYDLASWDISSGRNKSPSRRGSLATTSDTTTANESSPITLHQLIQKLPPLLRSQNAKIKRMSIEERIRFDNTIRGTDADAVNQLFGRLDLDKKEWTKYAIFDPSKNYTRNLIATDDETFTLLFPAFYAAGFKQGTSVNGTCGNGGNTAAQSTDSDRDIAICRRTIA